MHACLTDGKIRQLSKTGWGGGGGGGLGGGGEAVDRVNCGQENDEKWGNCCMLVN
jgi:hypothetical protein